MKAHRERAQILLGWLEEWASAHPPTKDETADKYLHRVVGEFCGHLLGSSQASNGDGGRVYAYGHEINRDAVMAAGGHPHRYGDNAGAVGGRRPS